MLKFPTKIINLGISYQVLSVFIIYEYIYVCLCVYIHTHTHRHLYWPPPIACRILVHQPGIKPMPLYWKCEVLITRSPGKALPFMFFEVIFLCSYVFALLFFLPVYDSLPCPLNFPSSSFKTPVSSFGEGNGNPLQYYCLEKPMDGGAWWAAVQGVTKSRTRLKWPSSSSSSLIFLDWYLFIHLFLLDIFLYSTFPYSFVVNVSSVDNILLDLLKCPIWHLMSFD